MVIYGEEKLKRDHPVAAFLASDKHAKSINVYPDGYLLYPKPPPTQDLLLWPCMVSSEGHLM